MQSYKENFRDFIKGIREKLKTAPVSKYPKDIIVQTDQIIGTRLDKQGRRVPVHLLRLIRADRNLKYPKPHIGAKQRSKGAVRLKTLRQPEQTENAQ